MRCGALWTDIIIRFVWDVHKLSNTFLDVNLNNNIHILLLHFNFEFPSKLSPKIEAAYVCALMWDFRWLTDFRTDSFLFRVGEWAVKFIYNSDKRFWIVHAWIRTHWLKQFRSQNRDSESRIVLSVCTSSDSILTERFFRFRAQTFVSDRSNYTISQFPNSVRTMVKWHENVFILWPRQRFENGRVRNSQQFIEGETAWKGLTKIR